MNNNQMILQQRRKIHQIEKKNYLKIEEKDVSLKAFLRKNNNNEKCF
jgi:hypothetical protein